MNRLLLLKYFVRSSTTFGMRSNYATFNNRKVLSEKKPVIVRQGNLHRFEDEFEQYIKTTNDLTSIHQFKKDILLKYQSKFLTEISFDAVFMRMCLACRNYPLGKEFLDHINQSGCQVNTATLARFLDLCYFCKEEIEDKSEVERLCYVLKSHSQHLDSKTQQSLILGFSITDKWTEGFKLLSEGDGTLHYSLPMNAMIDCLLKNDQIETAVFWMNKVIAKEHKISDFIYEHWLRKCAVHLDAWNSFFDFLVNSGVFLNVSIIQQLKDSLEKRHVDPFVGNFTTINEKTGRCQSCDKLLQNPEISDFEFADLKKGIMEKVLLDTNVYLGSKPDEIRRFQKFLKDTAPYDVVIDGLNVAYHRDTKKPFVPSMKLETLQSVVKYFTEQNLRVLVFTRKHLLKGPALPAMKQKAFVFATEDLSRDDPFLLSAAVQSSHTKFVSDDAFRDHLFRLADFRLQTIFRQWQHKAQMQIKYFDGNGRVKFHLPRNYRTVSQFADGCWHIPYDDGTPRYSYELPTTWLCLHPKSSKVNK